jgi:hypothetical protein
MPCYLQQGPSGRLRLFSPYTANTVWHPPVINRHKASIRQKATRHKAEPHSWCKRHTRFKTRQHAASYAVNTSLSQDAKQQAKPAVAQVKRTTHTVLLQLQLNKHTQ